MVDKKVIVDAPVDQQAQSEAVSWLFNYDKKSYIQRLSWSRWRKREIPLIASMITQNMATDPNRPKDEYGRILALSMIYIDIKAYLRLAEEGAMRNEGMAIFQTEQAEQASQDAWKE